MIIPNRREVAIDCDRCRKPVSTATSVYGQSWELVGRQDGGITPEGQLGGGLYGDDKRTPWRSRVWDVSPDRTEDPTWQTGESTGLHKLVCGRQHRNSRGRPASIRVAVTPDRLNRVCDAAAAAGRPRVSLADFR